MRYVFVILIVFFTFSCNKNNDRDKTLTQRQMEKVEGPASGNINQTLPLTVYWYSTSGSCDVLEKFEETKQGSVLFIQAFGFLNGGICTMDAPIKTKTYNFISTSAGTFELRFLNKDSSYIAHTVTIN